MDCFASLAMTILALSAYGGSAERNPPFTDNKAAGCAFRLRSSSYGGQVGSSPYAP
jgi:hypothetical protein